MGRSLAWRPRGKARFFFQAPTPGEWYAIAQAIREGWHVMLCWDADRDEWRCDFLRPGLLASGEGLTIGGAADVAWAATWNALREKTR